MRVPALPGCFNNDSYISILTIQEHSRFSSAAALVRVLGRGQRCLSGRLPTCSLRLALAAELSMFGVSRCSL